MDTKSHLQALAIEQSEAGNTAQLSFLDLLRGMRRRWLQIMVVAILASAAMFAWSNSQPRTYRAQIELAYVPPPDEKAEIAPGGLSGFASLLGGSSGNAKPVAIATLKSRRLLAQFIEIHKLRPLIFPKQWSLERRAWAVPSEKIPTPIEAAEMLRSKHLTVDDETEAGTIKLALTLPDQRRVALLANELVRMADSTLRLQARHESQRKLEYLRAQLATAANLNLQSAIAQLISTELQKQTIAQTGSFYSFQVIDPAFTPRRPTWPRPLLMTAVTFVLCALMGCATSAMIDLGRAERRAIWR